MTRQLVMGGGGRWSSAVGMMVVGAMVVRVQVCDFWARHVGQNQGGVQTFLAHIHHSHRLPIYIHPVGTSLP